MLRVPVDEGLGVARAEEDSANAGHSLPGVPTARRIELAKMANVALEPTATPPRASRPAMASQARPRACSVELGRAARGGTQLLDRHCQGATAARTRRRSGGSGSTTRSSSAPRRARVRAATSHVTTVVVHLESGDEVVIVEGQVERGRLDAAAADAYEAKYAFRPDPTGPRVSGTRSVRVSRTRGSSPTTPGPRLASRSIDAARSRAGRMPPRCHGRASGGPWPGSARGRAPTWNASIACRDEPSKRPVGL